MAGFFIIFAFVLGGAALLFKQAADQIAIGTGWANDVCSTSKLFCQHPEYLAYAGGIVLILAVGLKLGSIAR
jgi:hypothetical protein